MICKYSFDKENTVVQGFLGITKGVSGKGLVLGGRKMVKGPVGYPLIMRTVHHLLQTGLLLCCFFRA